MEEKILSFEEFLTTQSVEISTTSFLINLLVAAFLAYILSKVYSRFGHALSNRRHFAGSFVIITVTTMIIISVVKSSLALSLGLVGALSIVRFRAAIKEPEELAYLFLTISIGLGLGADQMLFTVLGVAFVITVILIRNFRQMGRNQNVYLKIESPGSQNLGEEVIALLNKSSKSLDVKRIDSNSEKLEMSFMANFPSFEAFTSTRDKLLILEPGMTIRFIDRKGIF